jgi:hypothetical protein
MYNFLDYYTRVTLSLLLIIANAIPITITTIPPATKLETKFANEGVIYKISFFFNSNKIKNSKINYNIYCIKFL